MSRDRASPEPHRKLYVVATVHLDTQWRWTVQDTIARFIPDTLQRNFDLLRRNDFFVVSFEGAFRYMLMKEYYPEQWIELRQWVDAGRWRPAGSMLDSPDVNVVSPESLIRHVLYGNRFFARELGQRSEDLFLPDCFGFGAAVPSVAAHCRLLGFSAQKFGNWMAPATIPFDVGFWQGPDRRGVPAALRPEGYGEGLSEDLSRAERYRERIDHTGETSGAYVAMKYVGVGDRGGGLDDPSVAWLEQSITGTGPIEVELAGSDQLFRDLPASRVERLPRYQGELLLPTHGTGCLTSQAQLKRWNRQNELLAEAAEKAATTASMLGLLAYPSMRLEEAWTRFLWHQMHDDLTGTSIPKAYQFTRRDELLSLHEFSGVLADAVGAISGSLDTDTAGDPVIVFNPLSIEREDLVEVLMGTDAVVGSSISVVAPDGSRTPGQFARNHRGEKVLLFLARVPALGFAVYDIRSSPSEPSSQSSARQLVARDSGIENAHYRVDVDANGDVASIIDKRAGRELLAHPIRLQLLLDRSARWPAWEILFEDLEAPPKELVEGPAEIEIVESGPLRVGLEIRRRRKRSSYVQTLRLAAGSAGERLEIETRVDWRTRGRLLKAAFSLATPNAEATYDLGLGQIRRGNNRREKYEVPAQQWADLTMADGSLGVSILNDGKYGWDKPDDATLRLSLLRSPRVIRKFRHQGSQDRGRHRFTLGIFGHGPDWRPSMSCWQAARLNQPLLPFRTAKSSGPLGREFHLLDCSTDSVSLRTLKRHEDEDSAVVRLYELDGRPARGVRLSSARNLAGAHELDGQERAMSELAVADDDLVFDLDSHSVRAFELRLGPGDRPTRPNRSRPVPIVYDCTATTAQGQPSSRGFDGRGHSYPAELLPARLSCSGVDFQFGPSTGGADNALTCRGQNLVLPDSSLEWLHLLAASIDGLRTARVEALSRSHSIAVPPFTGGIERWLHPQRGAVGDSVPLQLPGHRVAWIATHRHGPRGDDEPYVFCYLFAIAIEIGSGCSAVTLPDDNSIRLFAASLSDGRIHRTEPAHHLYD